MLHGLDPGSVRPDPLVAIDGKTVRRSHDRNAGQRANLVSAWAYAGAGEAKSNEITAIPQLLPMLELKGCIVTIDAMGCQKEIAQGILDRGAGYVLALKENQGQLYEDVRDLFQGAAEFGFGGVPHDYATTLNKDHGRIERRECWTISDPSCLEYLSTGQDWPGLRRWSRWWAAGRRWPGPRYSPGTTSAAWLPRRSDC